MDGMDGWDAWVDEVDGLTLTRNTNNEKPRNTKTKFGA